MVDELNRIRLDDDRSYNALAADIGIDSAALYKLLNDDTRDPWDRTVHKIRRFLTERKPTKAKPSRKGRGRAA